MSIKMTFFFVLPLKVLLDVESSGEDSVNEQNKKDKKGFKLFH